MQAVSLDRLGFGSAPIGGLYSPVPEADAIETIQFAYEQGIRFFDTAPKYGNGLSEERIGLALRGVQRITYRLASKAGWDIFTDGRDPHPAFSPCLTAALSALWRDIRAAGLISPDAPITVTSENNLSSDHHSLRKGS
jgi:D-threo-aldose 1-dehydrogenase